MGKLSYEDKINLYNDKKQGMSLKSLSFKYNIRTKNAQYLYCLIEKHGFEILRTSKNKEYSKHFKQDAINRIIINHESIWAVALDIGLPNDGMLQNWVKKYKENGYNIVERKRGRPTMKKEIKFKKNETIFKDKLASKIGPKFLIFLGNRQVGKTLTILNFAKLLS